MKKKYFKYINILIIVIIFLLFFYVDFLKSTLRIFILSFLIYYILNPIFKNLNKKINSKKISAILIILVLLLIGICIAIKLIPIIINESATVLNTIDEIEGKINDILTIQNYIEKDDILYVLIQNANKKIYEISYAISNDIFKIIGEFSENFFDIIVIPIILYYLFVDIQLIKDKILVIFPNDFRTVIEKICLDSDKMLKRYIISQFILVTIITMVTFATLQMMDVKYPLLLGIINGVFNVVPYFGPLIGALPAIFIALLESTNKALIVSVLLCFIQFIEGNVLSPKLTGDSIFIHPLVVIMILIISEKIGGLTGMILAVPIAVVIKIIIYDIDYYLY
ncbi:AI-2E family transporter [Clostridium sp. DL1XJH146]